MQKMDIITQNEQLKKYSKISNVHEFVQRFRLVKKNDRYNLAIHQYDLKCFAFLFADFWIEDLKLETVFDKNTKVFEENRIKFSNFFLDESFSKDHLIINLNGYFSDLDFYFYSENEILMLDYIHKDQLQNVFDVLLKETDCQFRSRLMTELLINLSFAEMD